MDNLQSVLQEQRAGVLVVGHGTRNPAGADQLRNLARQIQGLLPDSVVEGCFLELCEPDIATGIRTLQHRGCESLYVLPVLLFTAAHAKSDIPEAVSQNCEIAGLRLLGQTPSLGTHSLVLDLSAERFRQVVDMKTEICLPGSCAYASDPGTRCEWHQKDQRSCELRQWLDRQGNGGTAIAGKSVALAMVGRGTSDQEALEQMRRLTSLRASMTAVDWVETGFFAGGQPTVDELLERAGNSGCEIVVVQPHLLFEGELMDKLREKVRTNRSRKLSQAWWMTASLGADPELAEVFVGLLADLVAASKEEN